MITTTTRILADWSRWAAAVEPELRHPKLHVEPLAVDDLLEDSFRWLARDGAGKLEVQIWIQKGLAALVAQDPALFGAAAQALSREALARAEVALTLPLDLERLRAVAACIEGDPPPAGSQEA